MHNKTRSLTRIAITSALMCVGAWLTIPLGPVNLTMQTFFVYLAGILLTPTEVVFTQIVYLLIGVIGFPVFSGFTGGAQSILMPSFGFILSFIPGAAVISLLSRRKSLKENLLACLVGTVVIYAIGLPYMWAILRFVNGNNLSLQQVMAVGLIPFIPGDTLKLITASFVGEKIAPKMRYLDYER